MIVAIEGIDASGKHLQSQLLADYLKVQRHDVTSLAFPRYDGPIGAVIKELLTTPGAKPELKQAAMLADRLAAIDLLSDKSKTIICDRYIMSGIVYGIADGLEEPWLYAMHKTLPRANLQILLDVDPTVASRRRDKPRDEHEKNLGLMQRARDLYLDIWEKNEREHPYRWIVLDGTQPPAAINRSIIIAYNDLVDCQKNSWIKESEAAY